MTIYGNLIAGREVTGDQVFETFNPTTGDVAIATFTAADATIVGEAVKAALTAQPTWERLGLVARGVALRRLAVAMETATDELAAVIATEVGKPITEARAEVARSIVTLYYVAEQARVAHGENYASDDPTAMVLTARRALGAVGIITP